MAEIVDDNLKTMGIF